MVKAILKLNILKRGNIDGNVHSAVLIDGTPEIKVLSLTQTPVFLLELSLM